MKTLTPEQLQQLKNRKNPGFNKSSDNKDMKFPTELLVNSKFTNPNVQVSQESQIKTNKATLNSGVSNAAVVVTENLPAGEGWVRQEMPSKNISYRGPVYLRPLTVVGLKYLAAARAATDAKELNAFTLTVDALQPYINMDIRDLTVPDLFFMMYWLRLNSYPRSPLTITWTSKYGNENRTIIRDTSNFNIIEMKMTQVELEDWQQQGFTIPTVRDMEALASSDLSVSDDWELTYAQYMYIEGEITKDYIQKKIKAFHEAGIDAVSQIDEFSSLIEHGVIEEVMCSDDHFNLDTAITFLETELDNLGAILTSLQSGDTTRTEAATAMIGVIQHMDGRSKLLTSLREAKENGEEVIPEKEVVDIGTANINILFP